jgi:hypothetical protein
MKPPSLAILILLALAPLTTVQASPLLPAVFAAWTEGEQSFVLVDRPANTPPLELTLVNPLGWKHVTTAEWTIFDTSALDNQHTGRRVAHRALRRARHAPTAAVTFVGFDLDGHARDAPTGSGRQFRIALAGHVRDPKWIDGVYVLSSVNASADSAFEREARDWAKRVGQSTDTFMSDVRAAQLTAEIDVLVGCSQKPCTTYLRVRRQDWFRTTGRVYGILEIAGRRYLVTIAADFRLTVIDLSV